MTRQRVQALGLGLAAGAGVTIWILPVLWTVITSFKSPRDVFSYPPALVFRPTAGNYGDVLFGGFGQSILPNLATSLIVSSLTTGVAILLAVPAAYAFARLRIPGRRALGFYTLATQMIPPIGLVIPYFIILNRLRLLDTYQGLIIIYLTFSIPLALWILVSFFEDIPPEMEEAAFLDRANRWQALWHIILPQARGGIAVAAILTFLNAWNEFLFAIVLTGSHVRTITVAMYNFISVEQTLWGPLTAAATVAMLPVVIIGLGAQRRILQGLTMGAVK